MITSNKLQNVAFCSGGKDSVATVILAKEHGEPLDAVVFCEVMFDDSTSGEHPLHISFVHEKLKPYVENMLGVPFITLRSPKTYTSYFNHEISRGDGKGKTAGFPIPGMCSINRDCKMYAIQQFKKTLENVITNEYVGIAIDEPVRLARLGENKTSLLSKYNVAEQGASRLCEKRDLLSPVYQLSKRNGCWFCMNCCDDEWMWLIDNRPDLFNKLIELENMPNLYRKCLTRTETPSQIKARLEGQPQQLRLF